MKCKVKLVGIFWLVDMLLRHPVFLPLHLLLSFQAMRLLFGWRDCMSTNWILYWFRQVPFFIFIVNSYYQKKKKSLLWNPDAFQNTVVIADFPHLAFSIILSRLCSSRIYLLNLLSNFSLSSTIYLLNFMSICSALSLDDFLISKYRF